MTLYAKHNDLHAPDFSRDASARITEGTFSDPGRNVHRFGLREGMKVADFGSGTGAYTLPLAKIVGNSGRVYAVDVQQDLLTKLAHAAHEEKLDAVQTMWGNFEQEGGSRLADETVDFVLIANSLFLAEDKHAALREAMRVLKSGGVLAIVDWQDSFNGMGPAPVDVLSYKKAISLAADVGFAFVRDFPAGGHHYGVLFKKQSGV